MEGVGDVLNRDFAAKNFGGTGILTATFRPAYSSLQLDLQCWLRLSPGLGWSGPFKYPVL